MTAIQTLGQIISAASSACVVSLSSSSSASSSLPPGDVSVSHHLPSEVLRSFKELRRLRIELPSGELGVDDRVLLKWKADFGSTIRSCVLFCATSDSPISSGTGSNAVGTAPSVHGVHGDPEDDSGRNIPDPFYATHDTLKLRLLWTISSLIAVVTLHYLVQPIIADHTMLESLDLTDADGQGVLTMDKRQLQELRFRPVPASGASHRTLMPELIMQLWYMPRIQLPGGTVLNGATLVAIKPSEDATRDAVGDGVAETAWVTDAFEEPYRSAVRMLLKKRTYPVEMNLF